MEPIVFADDVRFSYPAEDGGTPRLTLRGVTVKLFPGTFTAILGRNGSGKSTLARHFNGLLLPEGGAVWVDGMDTRDEAVLLEIRRRVGMVFQNPDNQIVANVVEEDVAFAPENLGVPPEEIRRRVDDALRRVGMYEYREHAPHLLSGGQKQRIAIAGVLAMDPRCVVFDEATAMLDPRGRRDVLEIIRTLRTERGVAVALITHHMSEAALADRVIVLDGGEAVLDCTPGELFSRPELVAEHGLEMPDTAALLLELRKAGLDVPLDALSVDQCAEAVARALNLETVSS